MGKEVSGLGELVGFEVRMVRTWLGAARVVREGRLAGCGLNVATGGALVSNGEAANECRDAGKLDDGGENARHFWFNGDRVSVAILTDR